MSIYQKEEYLLSVSEFAYKTATAFIYGAFIYGIQYFFSDFFCVYD